MTVPMLAGWENLMTVVVVVLVCAVLFVVALAAGSAVTGRGEWQAWLESRSGRRPPAPRSPGSARPE